MATKLGQRTTLRAGPFKGVNTDRDPYNDPLDKLTAARNLYFPNPLGGVGAYQRPGFTLPFGTTPLVVQATAFRGQCVYSHPALDGSTINWIVMAGKLFRVSSDGTTATDVTPVGVTINASVTTKVFMISLIGNLIVTDGVNRPWIATNLTSTPITGTYIDYDGLGVSWTAFGAPWLYGNAIFFALNQVNGVSRRTDVSWCEPGLPAIGYQQTNFDNNWTLETSSSGVLYAGKGTNTAFYYWRELSIGAATGVVGPDLASSATEDSISFNVGAQACQTIQQFGSSFFFCDAIGRPWRFTPGTPPEPIWYQLRGIVETATTTSPLTIGLVATSIIEPTLNKYWVGIWSPTPSTQASVTTLYSFDAATGIYEGEVTIGPGIGIDCLGSFVDSSGRVTIVVLGSLLAAPATNGYVWSFNAVTTTTATALDLTTEGAVFITTEDGRDITTGPSVAVWQDNGETVDVSATTGRFGYSDDVNWNADQATVVTLTDSPVSVTVTTTAALNYLEGVPEPSASQDDTFRLVCGLDIFGRGPRVTVKPLDTSEQWVLESISLVGVASSAGPEDS